jgi:hypothetical protein
MSDQTFQDQDDRDKIDEYLRVIQERILAPIQNTEIRESCTATLLLLSAAIDGLGKLLHSDDEAWTRDRIHEFLDYMGGDYKVHKEELYELRKSLVHNAINVESFLSKTEMGADQHLKKMGAAGFLYVHTVVMYKDFDDAFKRFRAEIQQDPEMMKRAADRLEWREYDPFDDLDTPDIAIPTPPPPVEFIHAR